MAGQNDEQKTNPTSKGVKDPYGDMTLASRQANMEKLRDLLSKSLATRKKSQLSPMAPKNTNIGIAGLENLITGKVVPSGFAICLNGGTGSGRTVFALGFLYHGITKDGENGVYISFDEKKESVLATAKSFGWDFAKLEAEGKFIFIEYPYNELPQFVEKESAIADFIKMINARRLVIDPITPISMLFESELQKRKEMKKLFERLKVWGCTTMILTEGMSELEMGRSGVERLADGILQFYNVRSGTCRLRGLEVLKLRASGHSNCVHEFSISKNGVTVSKKKLKSI